MSPFERHLRACNNLVLPGGLVPLRIGGEAVGWLGPRMAAALAACPETFTHDVAGWALAAPLDTPERRSAALAEAAATLAARDLFRIRGELFDVRAHPYGPVLARLDRGALPAFGIMSQGVHLNGRVRRADGLHLWVGWRSRDKAVAPGQLDNLVAGGIPSGYDPAGCLLKEAEEEASLPEALARLAQPVGRVSYVMGNSEGRREGTRRDLLHCYDLDLPEDFQARPNDDEVERFELWPATRVLEAVRDTDQVKFNVNLVLIDLFLREGLIDPASDEGRRLRAGLDAGS